VIDFIAIARQIHHHANASFLALSGNLAISDWLALLAVFAASAAAARISMAAYCIVALPGTAAHELMHYLTALVLRARPGLPSVIPERTSSGWRLGSVKFSAGLLRSVPIALAPLALAPLSLWWANSTLPRVDGAMYALHAWGAATAFAASMPSRADWSIAAPALLLAAVLLGVSYAV